MLGERAMRPVIVAQAVSVAGTEVTALALPTLAVLRLNARPLAAALLFAIGYGAQSLAAPLLGVLVDVVRSRRWLLVAVETFHALVVLTVPVAYWLDGLSMGLLFGVDAVSGILAGLTAIGVQSMIPQLVPEDRLVAANAAITGARSVGQIAGPGLAGWLVQSIGAAVAMVADALSYGLSVLAYLALRIRQAPPARPPRQGIFASLAQGFAVMRERPALVRVAAAGAALNIGGAAIGGLYALYAYRTLHLTPSMLGLTVAVYSAAAMVGVATVGSVVRRLGLERVVLVFAPVAAAALLLIPAAAVLPAMPTLIAYEAIFGYCATVWTVASVSLVQTLVPKQEVGRVLAFSRSIGVLAIPIGALFAGVLADAWQVLPTIVVFAFIALGGTMAVVIRSARYQSAQPAPDREQSTPTGH